MGSPDMEDEEEALIEPDGDAVKNTEDKKSGIAGDERNILVLLFLYILQGIPLGLAAAIPLILTNRNVSYKQQAEFSFAYWPFSVKLLWAPIVDSCFISSFGRRKTWLVPVQYLIGVTMMVLSYNVDYYLGDGSEGSEPNVTILTAMFFFLQFWAVVFMIATTLVAVLKSETDSDNENSDEPDLGLVETYKLLLDIIRLKVMPVTIVMLLTAKIGVRCCRLRVQPQADRGRGAQGQAGHVGDPHDAAADHPPLDHLPLHGRAQAHGRVRQGHPREAGVVSGHGSCRLHYANLQTGGRILPCHLLRPLDHCLWHLSGCSVLHVCLHHGILRQSI